MNDQAWRASLAAVFAAAGLAFLALTAAGLDAARALGAVVLFLVAFLPCCVLVGAATFACRLPLLLPAVAGLGALLAALVTTGALLARGPGEDTVDHDRQGLHRNL